MVKKNRHRADRKKRERILHAQQRRAAEFISLTEPVRRVIRVRPQLREPSEIQPEQRDLPMREIF